MTGKGAIWVSLGRFTRSFIPGFAISAILYLAFVVLDWIAGIFSVSFPIHVIHDLLSVSNPTAFGITVLAWIIAVALAPIHMDLGNPFHHIQGVISDGLVFVCGYLVGLVSMSILIHYGFPALIFSENMPSWGQLALVATVGLGMMVASEMLTKWRLSAARRIIVGLAILAFLAAFRLFLWKYLRLMFL